MIYKNAALEISQNRQQNNCHGVLLTKIANVSVHLYHKKSAVAGVFLWILRNFSEQLFYQIAEHRVPVFTDYISFDFARDIEKLLQIQFSAITKDHCLLYSNERLS